MSITLCCWRLTPGFTLGAIIKKFKKCFGLSAPDLTHQLNFQLALQGSGESLSQWSDRVLTLATLAFPQLPHVHAQVGIPRDGGWSPFQGNSGSPEPHQGIGETTAGTAACAA